MTFHALVRPAMWSLALAVGFLATSIYANAASSVIETSIKDINKFPRQFDGKTLRFRGVMNECKSLTCNICTSAEQPNDENCLGIAFSTHDPRSSHDDASYRVEYAAKSLLEKIYRFAEITVEGTYDATCAPEPDVVKACTDRATTFTAHTIVAVHKRFSASKGLFSMYEGDPLKPVSSNDSREVIHSYRALLKKWELEEEKGAMYLVLRDTILGTDEAIICECLEGTCAGEWPTMSGRAYTESPANPFTCTPARKIDGKWLFWEE